MNIFNYELIDGHIIFEYEDKNMLLDTGSNSIGQIKTINFLNTEFDIDNEFNGLDIQKISKYVGCNIDFLIGINILRHFDLYIDNQNKELTFSKNNNEFYDDAVALDEHCIFDVVIEGIKLKAYFDTGAKVSYIPSEIVEENITCGRAKDFFPGYGSFETMLYRLDTQIGSIDIELKYGVLPTPLEESLLKRNQYAIIGIDILQSHNCHISLPNNFIRFDR